MPHPMKLRRLAVLLLVVPALGAAACTGDDPATPTASDPGGETVEPNGSPLPTVDPGAVEFEPGLFRYQFDSVTAELRWQGGEGELTIQNGSDRELDPPGLYAVTYDQREVPADVSDASPIGVDEDATFAIAFPDDVVFDETGMVVLLFGDENWGALAPVPVAEA
jgi:hypothetical protein